MTAAAKSMPATSSRLGAAVRGKLQHPLRYLIYGAEGVGKSTFAGHAPGAIFLDIEGGSGELDVVRYPFRDEVAGHIPRSLAEVYAALEDLRTSEHDYRHLVIDAVDALEALIWGRVVDAYSGVKGTVNKTGKRLGSIADIDYGRGYQAAVDEWRSLLVRLDALRFERQIAIVLIGHAAVVKHDNPLGENWDRVELRLHKLSAGLIKEWCEVIGYCAHEEGVAKMSDGDKPQLYSTGRRIMHLEHGPGWDAKTRIPMPARIVLEEGNPWKPFAVEVARGRSTSAKELLSMISAELKRIGDDELTAQLRELCKEFSDNTATLSRYLNRLKEK
jgi:hypothetical protein